MGRITGLTSPRYIHFVSDEKAYIIWDYRIFIVNPKTYQITGYIECPDMTMETGSTEQMVQYGKYVYVELLVLSESYIKDRYYNGQGSRSAYCGMQPTSLVMDKNFKMWTTMEGIKRSPYGYEETSLLSH